MLDRPFWSIRVHHTRPSGMTVLLAGSIHRDNGDKFAAMKRKSDDQVKEFRKAARELGCDVSEERFQEALRTVAKHKPQPVKDIAKRKRAKSPR
jgi:hypothetical protein